MFTGLIQTLGAITHATPVQGNLQQGLVLTVAVPQEWLANDPITIGESIALNGVCTTVTHWDEENQTFQVELSPETLSVTTLGKLKEDIPVNLERAMRANDRFGGHWVTGHVDSTARLIDKIDDGNSWRLYFRLLNPAMQPFLLHKGSIALDGISLTLNGVEGPVFDVAIIPHTWEVTTIGHWQLDDVVNVECDHLVKIVQQLSTPYQPDNRTSLNPSTSGQAEPDTPHKIAEAFFPETMGTSHIHTGRWFNLQ